MDEDPLDRITPLGYAILGALLLAFGFVVGLQWPPERIAAVILGGS
jgi:hypothetical protein